MDGIRFCGIRKLAETGLISEVFLRQRLAEGRLPGFYSGRKFIVNVPLLLEQLDRESTRGADNG